MVDEAMARRAARVSGICFEASSDRLSEGRYEGRLSMARRYDFDCAEGVVPVYRVGFAKRPEKWLTNERQMAKASRVGSESGSGSAAQARYE